MLVRIAAALNTTPEALLPRGGSVTGDTMTAKFERLPSAKALIAACVAMDPADLAAVVVLARSLAKRRAKP